MRRKEREIVDAEKIEAIVKSSHCCRLGFNDDGEVCIVPLNFGYTIIDEQYIFYFHGAKQGRKMDIIKVNPNVGFELDANYQLTTADTAYAHSARFQSIIGTGTISLIEDDDAKKNALLQIMKQSTGKYDWELPDKMIKATGVFQMVVKKMSAKEHL